MPLIKIPTKPPSPIRDVTVTEQDCLECGLLVKRTLRYKGQIIKREYFDCECDYRYLSG